jgi:hypothetical protein
MRNNCNPAEWGDWFNHRPMEKEQAKRLKVATILLLERLRLSSLYGAIDPRTVAAMHKANMAELQYECGGFIR